MEKMISACFIYFLPIYSMPAQFNTITINPGIPALAEEKLFSEQRIGVYIQSEIGPGEQFVFSAGEGRQITITEPNKTVYFPGTFSSGSTYSITQLSGPRTCETGTVNLTGIVQNEDIIIYRGCGDALGYSTLHCQLKAPAGTAVTFQNNGSNDITVKTDSNGFCNFNFRNLPDSSQHNVTVKSAPAGMVFTIKGTPGYATPYSRILIEGDFSYDLISRGNNDSVSGTFFESWDPGVSKEPDDNGRYVVFVSQAQGLCGSTGKYRQVYWRDRLTNKTIMISRAPDGAEGNGNSFAPVISVGSMYVAFESYAANLVADDRNAVRDVFLWRRTIEGGELERISTGPGGAEANGESFEPSVSGMGGHVAFSSSATNLTESPVEVSGVNVYLWQRNKTPVLISKDHKTGKGVGGSKPSIDMNGYRIAFCSYAYTLVPDDNNNLWDIFLYERNTSNVSLPLRRITMAYHGGERNQGDESSSRVVTPTISGDGRYIAYSTTASNVVPDDHNNAQDVFVYNTETNSTVRVSVDSNGIEGNGDSPYGQGERIALSYNGEIAAFTTRAANFGTPAGNVVMYNLNTKKMTPVSSITGGYVSTPSISRKGNYIVFGCSLPLDGRFNSSGLFSRYMRENQ